MLGMQKHSLEQVIQQVATCLRCPLHQCRNLTVPGEGNPQATIMFVGEGPGYHEDQQGRPFVGRAGHLLDELLNLINLSREQVFITNVIKCRPPHNRDPAKEEVSACREYLEAQIDLIKPRIIATLGRHSLAWFLPNETIGRVHGSPRVLKDYIVYPLYHPAAALRQQHLRKIMEDDMRMLPNLLKESIVRNSHTDSQPSKQLGLF